MRSLVFHVREVVWDDVLVHITITGTVLLGSAPPTGLVLSLTVIREVDAQCLLTRKGTVKVMNQSGPCV